MLRHLLLTAVMLTTAFSLAAVKEKSRFQQAGPIRLDKDGKKWVDKTLQKMSPEEKVGQLFMIWVRTQFFNEADPNWLLLRDNVRKYHIGSLAMSVPVDGNVLLKNQPLEAVVALATHLRRRF